MTQFASSAFGAALLISSHESSGALDGQVRAIIDVPFTVLHDAMKSPETWCEILVLHINTQRCTYRPGDEPKLVLAIARKRSNAIEKPQILDMFWKLVRSDAAHLSIVLHAPNGPLGTSNYRIGFAAIPLDARRSFVVLDYACQFSQLARLGMLAYLSTVASGKVGFSTAADRTGLGGGPARCRRAHRDALLPGHCCLVRRGRPSTAASSGNGARGVSGKQTRQLPARAVRPAACVCRHSRDVFRGALRARRA